MVRQIRSDLDEPVAWLAPRPDDIASVLDRIPGAWERMQLGREQAARGEVVELDALLTAPTWSR